MSEASSGATTPPAFLIMTASLIGIGQSKRRSVMPGLEARSELQRIGVGASRANFAKAR